jgi:K(+)-stimulated pyrophosphate-energized sodium pump
VIAYAPSTTPLRARATKRIAEAGRDRPGDRHHRGIAEGMKSTWAIPLTTVVSRSSRVPLRGGGDKLPMGLYGVGIAAVGMLSTLGITLAPTPTAPSPTTPAATPR